MREQLGEYLDELAMDDAVKVVLLRGEGGIFSTGADMGNAYTWYESPNGDGGGERRRPAAATEPAPAPARSTARRSASTTSSWATRR